MRQRWTLTVENFGKIKQASVEISPLMLFVGDNNSGKSYIMSLLWGILRFGRTLFPKDVPVGESYKRCDEWLKRSIESKSVRVDQQTQDMFVEWYNDILRSKKKSLIQRIFNNPMEIGTLEIGHLQWHEPVLIKWRHVERVEGRNFPSHSPKELRLPITKDCLVSSQERYNLLKYICWYLLTDGLCSKLKPTMNQQHIKATRYREESGDESALYIPAARTGFMLTYKILAQNLMEQALDTDEEYQQYRNVLPFPVQRFLVRLAGFPPRYFLQTESNHELADFLEERILQGKINKDDSPIANYSFVPNHSKVELPLHVTSSMVTELAPVILFLRALNYYGYRVVIIEEPESHLHPEAQRLMVRALARLVNSGVPVWITTHSDTFFQGVNNLIKLHNHTEREKLMAEYGYEENECINSEQVRAYQFNVNEGRTSVQALPPSEYGFAVPTFNESIMNLMKETLAFQEDEEDAD